MQKITKNHRREQFFIRTTNKKKEIFLIKDDIFKFHALVAVAKAKGKGDFSKTKEFFKTHPSSLQKPPNRVCKQTMLK